MHKMLLWAVLALTLPVTSSYPDAIHWSHNLDYPAMNSPVNMSYLNSYNIDNNGPIFIRNGHFWTQYGRINFFGTNLTFDVCFPDQEMAKRLASQLSALGVNIVRLHHMDKYDIWGQHGKDFSKLDPEQLQKLDYFIFCLKQKGIYVDLNLHVSWQYTNDNNDPLYSLVRDQNVFLYAKGLDTFLPELINKQKWYASSLLNHKNLYTGFAYKDDPVTAMVEINNENSFYRNMIIEDGIDLIPEKYHQILDHNFQKYLIRKYRDLNRVRKSWDLESNPKPLTMPGIMPMDLKNNWKVQISDPQKGTIIFNDGEAEVHLNDLAKNHLFQFYRTGLTFKKGCDYSLVVRIQGKKGATFRVNAMRQEAPYESSGLNKKIVFKTDGIQQFVIPFTATEELDRLGRITFMDFDNCNDFKVVTVQVYQGKYLLDPLKNVTALTNISIPALYNYPAYPAAYQNDLVSFFCQTELDYWTGMVDYLKKVVGVKTPITGTQIDYSFPELAKIYDYVDIHAYWQHPSYPGKPWDAKDYYVRNLSMVASPKTNFDRIALSRIKGKPFTISEYNHPYPNLHTTETPTMLAVVSKLQDYDAVFYYNFLDHQDISSNSHFNHYTKFACKAVYPAAALIFRDPAISPLSDETLWRLGENESFKDMVAFKRIINPYLTELTSRSERFLDLFKTKRLALQLTSREKTNFSLVNYKSATEQTPLQWVNAAPDFQQNFFKYDVSKAKIYIGWNLFDSYDFQNVVLKGIDRKDRYFQFTLINQNGAIGEKGHYILTLNGREFYTNVAYYDYDTKAQLDPSQENYGVKIMAVPTAKENEEFIENFSADLNIKLLKSYRTIKVNTINALGEPEKNIPFSIKDNQLHISLSREDESIIYSIDIED